MYEMSTNPFLYFPPTNYNLYHHSVTSFDNHTSLSHVPPSLLYPPLPGPSFSGRRRRRNPPQFAEDVFLYWLCHLHQDTAVRTDFNKDYDYDRR